MRKTLATLCLGTVFVVFIGGCMEEKDPVETAPVVIRCNWEQDSMAIGGRLMSHSSGEVYKPSEVRLRSGTIDGLDARGGALYEEDPPDQPVFEFLSATANENGEQVMRLVGKSDVEWVLAMEDTTEVVIRDASRGAIEPEVFIPPGPFDIEISGKAPMQKATESEEKAEKEASHG